VSVRTSRTGTPREDIAVGERTPPSSEIFAKRRFAVANATCRFASVGPDRDRFDAHDVDKTGDFSTRDPVRICPLSLRRFAHGVGQIIAVEVQTVTGARLELFFFTKTKMKARVPIQASIGIRKLSSPAAIEQARRTLSQPAPRARISWARLTKEGEEMVKSGDVIALAEVMRDPQSRQSRLTVKPCLSHDCYRFVSRQTTAWSERPLRTF
jgi:hypothetical protein